MAGHGANISGGSGHTSDRGGSREDPRPPAGVDGGGLSRLGRHFDDPSVRATLTAKVLEILSGRGRSGRQFEDLLEAIQKATALDAVALRLPSGEDFPYCAQRGFSPEFIRHENLLSARGPEGELLRDEHGMVILDCMCGQVLGGKVDSSQAFFFTKGGSFWTNSTSDLLKSTTEAERGLHTRNFCNAAGYESVALIPLTDGNAIAGLLQLNDRRRDQFSAEAIGFLEIIGSAMGMALSQHRRAEQLRQSQKMEAVGRLAGGVAHDFRNQLTVIKGYAEMLIRRGLVKDPGLSLLGEMVKAAERSTLITSQLLAFGRKQTLEPAVVDLAEMVRDLGKTMGRIIGEDIRVIVRAEGKPCLANVDPVRFQQAMMGLLTNAREAMPEGGKLTMEAFVVEADEDFIRRHPDAARRPHVAVSVSDTGCGMDESTLGRVFEAFFTTKPGGQGTGLGLSMVYGFVKQSDGQIEVASSLGGGSTFRLLFPLSVGGRTGEIDLDVSAGLASGSPGRRVHTILVVEDEEPVRKLLAEMLRSSGYEAIEAGSADEAIGILQEGGTGVDLLMTDVIMPGRSGLELARQVREDCPTLPILYLSGYSDQDLSRRGAFVPGSERLTKPCSQQELLDKVRKLLGAQS